MHNYHLCNKMNSNSNSDFINEVQILGKKTNLTPPTDECPATVEHMLCFSIVQPNIFWCVCELLFVQQQEYNGTVLD